MNELSGVGLVSEDPADLGSRYHDMLGPLGFEEPAHRGRIGELELRVRAQHKLAEAIRTQASCEGAARETGVPGYIDSCVALDAHSRRSSKDS